LVNAGDGVQTEGTTFGGVGNFRHFQTFTGTGMGAGGVRPVVPQTEAPQAILDAPVTFGGAPVSFLGAPFWKIGAPFSENGAPFWKNGDPVSFLGAPFSKEGADFSLGGTGLSPGIAVQPSGNQGITGT